MQQISVFFIGVIFASVFTSSVSAWYGTVTFYQDVEFDGTKYPWGISKTQRCYNLSCWDSKASSVKWEGLPKKGSFSGKSRIAFYTDKNCKGDVRHWPTDAADDDGDTGHYPKDFTLDFVNDKITSFMVWETSEKITNGVFFYLPVSAWYGVVTFYQHTDFKGTDFPWSITETQRCYNLGCFNDKASSAKWEGLPVIGKFNGQARIAFFKGKECTGDSRDWPTDGVINDKEGNYPKDFSLDGINDAVSSFMVWAKATDLWLYDDDDYDKHKTFKKFNFGTSQRCYSIVDCFDNKASSASWINAPKDVWFVFYDGEECSGTQYISTTTPTYEMKFASVNLDNKISSFMLWEYSTYPVMGIVNLCHDAAILLPTNNSANSTVLNSDNSGANDTIKFY